MAVCGECIEKMSGASCVMCNVYIYILGHVYILRDVHEVFGWFECVVEKGIFCHSAVPIRINIEVL